MGTTAQKLEYLGTTKSQLKDMINYGLDDNNKITSSTTFRNYVSSIFNAFLEALRTPDTLFTNLPKKSGTGANITLNDTANAPMRIELGASELSQSGTPTPSSPQDIHTISGSNKVVVEGKNLFDIDNAEHKWINQSGTIEDNNSARIIKRNCSVGEVFTLTANYTGNNGIIAMAFYDKNGTKLDRQAVGYQTTLTITMTAPSNTAYLYCGSYTIYNLLNVQLELGNQATTYEPYISQEADIDLKSKNLLPISTLTTSVSNGITFINNGDGSYSFNGTASGYTTFNLFTNLSFNGNYTYVLKDTATTGFNLYAQNSSGSGIGTISSHYTIDNNIAKLVIGISGGTVLNGLVIRPYVYKGTYDNSIEYQDYYDYGEYCKIGTYEDKFIRTSGKNLFNGTGWRLVQSGNGFPQPGTGATIVSSDKNNISFTSTQQTYAGVESGFIKVKANETYMLSAKFTTPTNRFFITQYDENKTRISTLNSSNVSTLQNTSFTTTNNGYITVAFTNTTTAQTTYRIEDIMIEKGSTATEYEPYGTNEWYLKKNIGKVVLDGTEYWSINSSTENYTEFQAYNVLNPVSPSSYNFPISNYFSNTVYNRTVSNAGLLLIRVPASENITTAENFKTWLSTHNTEVYYFLATPTYTQITGTLAEQLEYIRGKMLSQTGQTNISQVNNDLAFNISASAIEEL